MKLSKEHYQAEAAVVWCFDARFQPALEELKKKLGLEKIDLISVAGGAKDLVGPSGDEALAGNLNKIFSYCLKIFRRILKFRHEALMGYLIRQIEISVRLHNTKKIILMTHSDCGAFGGLKAFDNSEKVELARHIEILEQAKKTVMSRFPGLSVVACFVDFETVHLM